MREIFYWPDVTVLVLLHFIAARAIITAIFEILLAIEFRKVFPGESTMIIGGMLSVLLGIFLFVFPAESTTSLVWLIGLYAIIAGLIKLIFAFLLWNLWSDLKSTGIVRAWGGSPSGNPARSNNNDDRHGATERCSG